MKRTKLLFLLALVCAVILAAAPALASGTAPFSFRNGICFGMSEQEIIQTEAANGEVDQDAWESSDMSFQSPGLSLLASKTTVKVSTYDAVVGYFLVSDQMQGAAYDFAAGSSAMYQDLSAALTAVYGAPQTVDFDVVAQALHRLVPSVNNNAPAGAAPDVPAWQLDNVTIYLFYYDTDMLGILYLNPDFSGSQPVNTTGI